MKYDCVIWDWNGTLLDDISASLRAVNDMLAARGMKPIDVYRYRECIGIPIRCFYDAVFNMEKEDYPALLAEYNRLYAYYVDKDIDLAPGARELLAFIRDSGARQVIVSSSQKNVLEKDVERYGISGFFDAVLGSEDFLAGSKIDRAVNYLKNAYPDSAPKLISFGDLVHDADLGKAVGADCVLLASGHEDRGRLDASGLPVAENFAELKKYLI